MIRNNRWQQGFTLVEGLMTLAVTSIAAVALFPSIQHMIRSAKLEGVSRETAQLIQRARLEAVRQSTQTVVRIDAEGGRVIAFADLNGETAGDPPDGLFNPLEGAGRTDYEFGQASIPSGVLLASPAGESAVDGLTSTGSEQVVLLNADGSAEATGAYRFGDLRENFIEVRVAPRATARVTVAKWDSASGSWWTRGEGARAWKWN